MTRPTVPEAGPQNLDDARAQERRLTVERIAQKIEVTINDPINREHYPEAVRIYQNALGLVLEEARDARLKP
jgi:hypothetical protein